MVKGRDLVTLFETIAAKWNLESGKNYYGGFLQVSGERREKRVGQCRGGIPFQGPTCSCWREKKWWSCFSVRIKRFMFPLKKFSLLRPYKGFQITFDLRRPAFDRVAEILVRCSECKMPKLEALNLNKVYKVKIIFGVVSALQRAHELNSKCTLLVAKEG